MREINQVTALISVTTQTSQPTTEAVVLLGIDEHSFSKYLILAHLLHMSLKYFGYFVNIIWISLRFRRVV